ncbi:MAG: ribosome maturation factor RimM [Wolinella sp.]
MQRIEVARFGRAVGLKGEVKLHILTDFPELLGRDSQLFWDGGNLTLSSFNPHSNQARFDEIITRDDAQKLTNHMLYTTQESTIRDCVLDHGEYFWFEIVGCDVVEAGENLGKVDGVERIALVDYLIILTEPVLAKRLGVKRFLIPYIPQYVISTNIVARQIECVGARGILEAS